jgi:FixJ family two-component response regulator
MTTQPPTLFVVDDDPGVCLALESVGRMMDLPVTSFLSAGEFLANNVISHPGCLVLDVNMPGMTGLELQQRLISDKIPLPVIMLTGYADVRIAVQAMQQGAMTVLEKPCRLEEIANHVRRALDIDLKRREARARMAEAESRFAKLTEKEQEVFDLVVAGKTNKAIAARLNLSVRAVEDRRSRMMKKLGTRSIAELVKARITLCKADS